MDADTRERIERLRAHCNSTYDVMMAFMGWDTVSPSQDYCGDFRSALIDLLERSDPDEWTDEQLEECGLIRMPRDKDGVIINVGDTVWSEDGREWTVVAIEIKPHLVIYCRFEDSTCRFTHPYHEPKALAHYQIVTVESVLKEFASTFLNCCDGPDTIAEYAKRLRLAGDGE